MKVQILLTKTEFSQFRIIKILLQNDLIPLSINKQTNNFQKQVNYDKDSQELLVNFVIFD